MIDAVVRGGWVVTPQFEGPFDVGISGEHIAYLASPGQVEIATVRR